jgi:hypothetical protein
MHVRHAILCTVLAFVWFFMATAQSVDPRLDRPDDAQGTAAYRAIPAIAEQMARIKFCSPAVGRPGVEYDAAIKASPTAPERGVTIHFARGPDSAWVGEIE